MKSLTKKGKGLTTYLVGVFMLLSASLFIASCSKETQTQQVQNITLAVRGLNIVSAPLIPSLYGSGVIRGADEEILVAKTNGKVTKVSFDEKDYVEQGQILAEIENIPLLEALNEVEAELAVAQREFELAQQAYEKQVISQKELEQEAAEKTQEQTITQIRSQFSWSRKKKQQAQEAQEQLEAELTQQAELSARNEARTFERLERAKVTYYSLLAQANGIKEQYDTTRVRSPLTGYVIQKNFDIRPETVVQPGSFVARVSNKERVTVTITLTETLLPWLSQDDKVQVSVPSDNLGPYEARIQSIDAITNSKTGGIDVMVVWMADKQLQDKLDTGLIAEVLIDTSTKDGTEVPVPIVPKSVILSEEGQNVIYIAQKSTTANLYEVQRKVIETGREFVGSVEVSKGLEDVVKGITASDAGQDQNQAPVLIISATESLADGQQVSVEIIGDTGTY